MRKCFVLVRGDNLHIYYKAQDPCITITWMNQQVRVMCSQDKVETSL